MSMQPPQQSTYYDPSGAYAQQAAQAQYGAAAPGYDPYGGAAVAAPAAGVSKTPAIIGGVGLLVALLALLGAWYSISLNMGIITASVDWSVFGSCSLSGMGQSLPCSTFATSNTSVFGAMAPGLGLLAVGLIMLLLGTLMGFTGKMAPRKAGMLSLIGGVMCLVAPLTIVPTITGAVAAAMGGGGPTGGAPMTGFMGSVSMPGGFGLSGTISWGPGGGWWMSIIAGVIGIVAGVAWTRAKPVAPPATAAPMQGYGYAAQAPAYAAATSPSYGGMTGYSGAQTQAAPAQAATKNCPSCGTLNWATSATCGKCGASVSAPAAAVTAPAQAATKNCPACGTLNWATSANCGKCGAAMGG